MMAASERVQGISAAIAMVESLAPAARTELAEILDTVGPLIAEEQRSLAPERTGRTRAAITWQAVAAKLLLKAGLLFGKSQNDAFYGRIVHFGRRDQTVLVQRRRRVGGVLRTLRRKKRVEDIVATYALHVKARPARPFVVLSDDMETAIDTRLADFWSRALARING